jgi:1,2-dihydroxy-3-keto-5-methylthiopentene dioxygenase
MSPSERVCSADELRAEGIVTESCDPAAPLPVAERLRNELGWQRQDDVRLSVMNPRDEATIAREIDEHLHLIGEARLIVEGEGVYDVRARDERWIRIWVGAGDVIFIPERRYHRFLPSTNIPLRYLQIYSERPGLTPLYRASSEDTRAG